MMSELYLLSIHMSLSKMQLISKKFHSLAVFKSQQDRVKLALAVRVEIKSVTTVLWSKITQEISASRDS